MRTALLLLAILGAALLLRLWNLGGESAWLDEVYSLSVVEAPSLAAYWRAQNLADDSPKMTPGYYTLAYYWGRWVSTNLVALRVLSILAGTLSVLVLFGIGRRLGGNAAGLVAALCLAFSMPHIFYSQEVRRYAWGLLLALLSFYALFKARPPGEAEPFRRGWLAAQLVVAALLQATALFTIALLPVQALYLCWRRRGVPNRWLAGWLVCAAFLALVQAAYIFSLEQSGQVFWIPPAGWREVANSLVVFAGGRFSNDNPAATLPGAFNLDLLLAALLYGAALTAVFHAAFKVPGTRPAPSAAAYTLALWLFFPVFLWFAVSKLWQPLFLYRYFLFASFPLYLLAGLFAASLRPRARRAFVAVLLALFAWQALPRFITPFRPDYRAAAAKMAAGECAAPVLVLKETLNGKPLRYLDAIDESRLHFAESGVGLHKHSLALARTHGTAWVVMWRWDRTAAFREFLEENGIEFEARALGGMPPLLLWRLEGAKEAPIG